jgi:hypothetical protein
MPTQTAKFVSAVFAGILATIPLTIASHGETPAPDNCLSSPKGDAPAGNHWFYRIDQSTKRHCWYLRAQGDRISQGAPQNILPSPKPPPQTDTVVQRSLADAHAELPAQTNRNDAPNTDLPPATADWNAAPRANATNANAGSAAMPSSWPQPSVAAPTASPQEPATASSASSVPPSPVASLAPADTTIIPAAAAAAAASPDGDRGLMPLLVALMGAFTLACGLVAKFARPRQSRPRIFRARRGPIWELTDDDRIVLSDDPGVQDLPRRRAFSQTVGNSGRQTVGNAGRRNSSRAREAFPHLSGHART